MTEEPTRRSPLLPYINEMSLVAHISFGDLMINPIQQSRQSTNFPTAETVVGSGLAALGTFLRQAEPRLIRYRTLVFVLIAAGVGAMWGLTAKGGFGGKSGLSIWKHWGRVLSFDKCARVPNSELGNTPTPSGSVGSSLNIVRWQP